MSKPIINIQNYIPELINLDEQAFTNRLDTLIDKLSINQPDTMLRRFIGASINNATKPWGADLNRDIAFQRLLDFDLTTIAKESFQYITDLLPSPVQTINCHIVPSIETKGGGLCFAPGNILLCIKTDTLASLRLQKNIAHEYSHTIRMIQKPQETEHGFGEAVPYSVRDYLIFEGLACTLAETLFEGTIPEAIKVSDENESEFWNSTDLTAVGMNAYAKYIGRIAYEVGSRIVRQYLRTHNISIIRAHDLSDSELYWNSGYKLIK